MASPVPVEGGGKDLSNSDEEEVIQYSLARHLQRCMFKHNDGSTEVVMMEAGGILVGAAAKRLRPTPSLLGSEGRQRWRCYGTSLPAMRMSWCLW